MVAYIIKSSLLLALFYAFFILFMRRTTFFRFNRVSLMFGTACCMFLPLLNFSTGMMAVSEALPNLVIPEITVTGNAMETDSSFKWISLFACVYPAGALSVLILTLVSLKKTLSIIYQTQVEKTPVGKISIVDGDFPSFSFFRNIVISRDDYVNNPVILQHEMAHVRFLHSADMLFFSVVMVFHWFNPLVWIIMSELRMLHEYEADEAVINQGIDATQYQLLLVKKAVGAHRFQLANGFNHTKLKNRITMMQTAKTNKWAKLGYVLCIPVLMCTLCLCTNVRNDGLSEDQLDEIHVIGYRTGNGTDVESRFTDEQAVPLTLLDEEPKFDGEDANAFARWVNAMLVYPESAKEAGVHGKVLASFKINADGTVSDVHAIEGVCAALDNEVIRVISQSPTWTPGKEGGKAVPVAMTIPVFFALR